MRRQWILPAVLLLAAALAAALGASVVSGGLAALPEAILAENPAGLGVPVSDVEEGAFYLDGAGVLATVTGREQPVRVRYAAPSYAALAGLRFVHGGFFSDSAPDSSRVLVISSALAEKLFMTLEVSGSTVGLGDETYIICGVYESEGSFLADLSGDGAECVYLPLPLAGEEARPTGLLMQSEGGFARESLEKVSSQYGGRLTALRLTDFREQREFLGDSLRFLGLWGAFVLMVLLFTLAAFVGGSAGRELRALRRGYRTAGGREVRLLWLRAGLAFLCASAGVLAVCLAAYTPHVPMELLPVDNVLDISHYLEEYTAAVQSLNSAWSFWPALSLRALTWSWALSALSAGILTALTAVLLRKLWIFREYL